MGVGEPLTTAASGLRVQTSATLDDVTFAFDRRQPTFPTVDPPNTSVKHDTSRPAKDIWVLLPSLYVFLSHLPAARQRRIHSMSGILSSLVMGDRRARTSDAVLNIVTAGALVRRLPAFPVAIA